MSSEPKAVPAPRTVADADWPAMGLLGSTAFGVAEPPEALAAWRSQVPPEAAVVVEDAGDVVGQSMYLDLRLTVPGGQVLPTAGVTWVAVAPTYRRRGLLRSMYTELHQRIAAAGYPMAALTASEGGIYGRFGYGPATVEREITIDRRFACFHPDVPDPGGVRMVTLVEHRDAFESVYERWRQVTPGGLVRWRALWDEVFADREDGRRGASPWYAFLHADGYALYRVHGFDPKTVRVEEMNAVTRDARVALWRALCGLDLVERIVVGSHQDETLPYLLSDPRLARTTGLADDLWLRIMNVPVALEARTYPADVSAVLQVGDGFRDDGGAFALEVRDGRARCTRTDAPADVHLDLDVLGSLYLGAHRASAFAHANRLRCNDSGLLHRLEQAFAGEIPAVLGFGF